MESVNSLVFKQPPYLFSYDWFSISHINPCSSSAPLMKGTLDKSESHIATYSTNSLCIEAYIYMSYEDGFITEIGCMEVTTTQYG